MRIVEDPRDARIVPFGLFQRKGWHVYLHFEQSPQSPNVVCKRQHTHKNRVANGGKSGCLFTAGKEKKVCSEKSRPFVVFYRF